MPAPINKTIDCPVCTKPHGSFRWGATGVDAIACPEVTPPGAVRGFPGFFVMVLGAGIGVDAMPPRVESAADKAARLAGVEAELRKYQEQAGRDKTLSDFDKRLADAEAELAAVKGGAPVTVPETVTVPADPPKKPGRRSEEAP